MQSPKEALRRESEREGGEGGQREREEKMSRSRGRTLASFFLVAAVPRDDAGATRRRCGMARMTRNRDRRASSRIGEMRSEPWHEFHLNELSLSQSIANEFPALSRLFQLILLEILN